MKRIKDLVESGALRVRTGWFLLVVKNRKTFELHIGYQYYDKTVSLFSTDANNNPRKKPWGAVKGCKFKQNVKNAKGKIKDYMQFENEFGEKRLFDVKLMKPLLWEINDFTQLVGGLRSQSREDILSLYLNLMCHSEGYSEEDPDSYDANGFKVKSENKHQEILSLGGS